MRRHMMNYGLREMGYDYKWGYGFNFQAGYNFNDNIGLSAGVGTTKQGQRYFDTKVYPT